jgi:uncharacterized membrane protein
MDWLYQVLASVGYHHPLHPPLVHLPIGMVIGALLFQSLAAIRKAPYLENTARHCSAVALVALPVAVIGGFLDWNHYYAGAWLLPVKIKMFLASALLGVLVCGVWMQRRSTLKSWHLVVLYGLPLLLVAGLGYFGGELVYATSRQTAGVQVAGHQMGEQLFRTNCGSCHPDGGNTLKPTMPLRSAPQVADERVFVEYLRNPKAREGATTLMPAFSQDRLSDGEALQIRRYVIEVLRPQS